MLFAKSIMSPLFWFQWFIFCFHIFSTYSTSILAYDHNRKFTSTIKNIDFDEKYYTQTLDHFNYNPRSSDTFQQRYFNNSQHWGGASSSSPFFVFLGAEGPLSVDSIQRAGGLLIDNAPKFKAYLTYIEHRFYGKSSPLGSQEAALKDEYIRGHFNSAQALADFAEIIIGLKKNLSAESCPVIVFGGSYGGMLSSWFRLKYPHVALGALASSAPVRLFYDVIPDDAYFSIVSKDFRDTSQSCFNTIKKSWDVIDTVANQADGLQKLSKIFKTCQPLTDPDHLKGNLAQMYRDAAQGDNPPIYPVTVICNAIDGAASSDILDKIFAGVSTYFSYYQSTKTCYINQRPSYNFDETISQQKYDDSAFGWFWQSCSEMLVPIGIGGGDDSMFQPNPTNLTSSIQGCKSHFHVDPRPDWIPTYYGALNMKLSLKRFGSNIIYSNGLRDPYIVGGILEDISDTIRAVKTVEGAHCIDLDPADAATDPDWLVKQRETEMNIIQEWINQYYDDLRMIKSTIPTFEEREGKLYHK